MMSNTMINGRTAIADLPLAIVDVTAAAKGYRSTPAKALGILDERELNYALDLITHASTSGIASSFIALAQHISTLANAGDCETIRTVAERFTDHLYQEHNFYNETRATWIVEEINYFTADVVDMDDQTLTWPQREAASERADARHARRSGEV